MILVDYEFRTDLNPFSISNGRGAQEIRPYIINERAFVSIINTKPSPPKYSHIHLCKTKSTKTPFGRLRMAPPSLLGPPELYNQTQSNKSEAHSSSGATDPFMDLMVANFNKINLPERLPKGFTENQSPTFLTSGNPCLDFFFHVVPDTPSESLTERLRVAWVHDPLTTLKLICNLRGVRGTGKSDKEGFYTAAFWLYRYHPKTLACNVGSLADFGYFKDLPEILYRLLEGPDVRRIQKTEWEQRKGVKANYRRGTAFRLPRHKKMSKRSSRRAKSTVAREIRVSNAAERAKKEQERASVSREEKRIAMAKKVVDRYVQDPDFQFLYEKVSEHFAECLKADMDYLTV